MPAQFRNASPERRIIAYGVIGGGMIPRWAKPGDVFTVSDDAVESYQDQEFFERADGGARVESLREIAIREAAEAATAAEAGASAVVPTPAPALVTDEAHDEGASQ
jgi:hypothetical protein